jgi:hypothetical protein
VAAQGRRNTLYECSYTCEGSSNHIYVLRFATNHDSRRFRTCICLVYVGWCSAARRLGITYSHRRLLHICLCGGDHGFIVARFFFTGGWWQQSCRVILHRSAFLHGGRIACSAMYNRSSRRTLITHSDTQAQSRAPVVVASSGRWSLPFKWHRTLAATADTYVYVHLLSFFYSCKLLHPLRISRVGKPTFRLETGKFTLENKRSAHMVVVKYTNKGQFQPQIFRCHLDGSTSPAL